MVLKLNYVYLIHWNRKYSLFLMKFRGNLFFASNPVRSNFAFCFSDGAGRSGVYLAIDANIELSEEDGVFDVYGYLTKMRQQRRGLVETLVSHFSFTIVDIQGFVEAL